MEGDGAAGLGAAADVVELEAHEGLDEGALAVGLVADDEDGGGVEGGVEVLGEGVKLVVGFVEAPLALLLLLIIIIMALLVLVVVVVVLCCSLHGHLLPKFR